MAKTPHPPEVRFDVASAMSQGRREYQEDALATDFPLGAKIGLAVLADGMGGHVAGDVASQIAVTEVFSDLKLRVATPELLRADIPGALNAAVRAANDCLGAHCAAYPQSSGMGATVVGIVLDGPDLWWISVGDSPLYLYRRGELRLLNEDHSLAPQIDFLVSQGLMDPEVGRTHPDRHCLTSVLIGRQIERIDCAPTPLTLEDGDLLILASDGLQSLSDAALAGVIEAAGDAPAAAIAQQLLDAVEEIGDPDQDNVTFAVIRASFRPVARVVPAAAAQPAELQPVRRAPAPVQRGVAAAGPENTWLRRSITYVVGRKPPLGEGQT